MSSSIDAIRLAPAALLEPGPVDVAHFHDVGQVDVLRPNPGHQALRVLVAEDPAVHVIVAGIPAELAHVDPAAGSVGFFDKTSGNHCESVRDADMFGSAQDLDIPFAGRKQHVDRTRDAPVVFVPVSGHPQAPPAAGITLLIELRPELDGIGGMVSPVRASSTPGGPSPARAYRHLPTGY